MTAQAQTVATEAPALVVFGRDDAGKAHGSAFGATDAERALAEKLPRGRVFASGKAFVPFIKATLLTELQTAAFNGGLTPLKVVGGADAEAAKPPATAPAKPPKGKGNLPVKQPCGWADIQVGAIVLAAASPKYHEWYECVVVAIEGEDNFSLRYCDYPREPPFARWRGDIALLHPAYTPEPPLEAEPPAPAA